MKLNNLASTLVFAAAVAAGANAAEISTFPIGTTWPDTQGVHINCHGGCVVPYEGAFYWFGESRTGGHSDGISVYRSTDLYNWENLGFAVTHGGVRDDENLQDISEGRLLERPKVIYNAKTGKWVMWAHWENGQDYGQARVAILRADKITGPYEFVSTMRPNGHDSRDQTLFLDTDGNAYHFCSTNMNTDINVVRLSDDFLTPSADETLIMKGGRLEASTVCKVDEMYFATFSECNGWDPAPGHSATAIADPLGEWKEGLNFCTDADANRSYRSQGAFVFSVETLGYDPKCFIFYGDRWNSSNVGGSTYVWLPLSVRSGYPVVRNYATWNLDEVMKDMYRFKRAAAIADGGEYMLLERRSDRFVSRIGRQAGFCIKNDDERVNVSFEFVATADPYVWKLRDSATGQFLTSRRGKVAMQDGGEGNAVCWRFVLVSDGYYNVINEDSKMCLTVASNARADGSEIVLGSYGQNDAQAFGVYFDSKKHADYAEAPMYTAAYYDEVARRMAEQNYTHSGPGVESLPFVENKEFAVMHTVSGLAVTFAGGSAVKLDNFTQQPSQALKFVPTSASAALKGYHIVDANGNYLYQDGAYSLKWASDADLTAESSVFDVESTDSRLLIKRADNGKYLGTDQAEVGASLYSDKQGDGRNLSYWYLADFNNSVVVTPEDLFYETLDNADILFGSIDPAWCGTNPFDIDSDAYAALDKAIDKAFGVTDGFEAADAELKAALEAYEASKTVEPVAGKEYAIRQNSGLYLGAMDGNDSPVLVVMPGENIRYVFEKNENGYYGIANTSNKKYLSNLASSAWSMTWADDAKSNRAQWSVSINSLGNKAIYNVNRRGYIGSDATSDGASVYCNKGIDETNSQWSIIPAEEAGIDCPDAVGFGMSVSTYAGVISVSGEGTVEVYNLAGVALARTNVAGTATIAVPAGLYIVRLTMADGTVSAAKVAVK